MSFIGISHDGFVRIALPWEPQGEEPKVPAGTLLSSDDSALGTFARCPARSIVRYRVNAPVKKPGYWARLSTANRWPMSLPYWIARAGGVRLLTSATIHRRPTCHARLASASDKRQRWEPRNH